MIDRGLIGHKFPPHRAVVERGRLRLFTKATGEPLEIYRDVDAARRDGHPDVPIPPTYLLCLEMDRDDPFDFISLLAIDISRILHGEQAFTYHEPIHAGEAITFQTRIADIFDKRGGELEFVILETSARKENDRLAAEMRRTIVVRGAGRDA